MHIEAEGVGVFDRDWSECVGIHSGEKGVVMAFDDGMIHWLPNRVFESDRQRGEFVDFVGRRLAEPRPAS